MEKKKKDYESPHIEVTQVEIESAICSGSVEITAQAPNEGISTDAQEVNTSFGTANDFSNSSSWDN